MQNGGGRKNAEVRSKNAEWGRKEECRSEK
jgi:hypothetical protein